jgi:hypothetical protein
MQIISAIFRGEVITAEFGKLAAIRSKKKGGAMADPAFGAEYSPSV